MGANGWLICAKVLLLKVASHLIGRENILIPVYKGRGDSDECGSYMVIKLLNQGMKAL